MPKRKQSKTPAGRRKAKIPKMVSSRVYNQRVPMAVDVCPDAIVVKLKYATSYRITSALFEKTFRGNGLYDPDQSGVGHQPLGFDQWMAFYAKYRCYASRIKVTILNNNDNSTSPNNNVTCVVLPTISSSAITSDEQGDELMDSKTDDAGKSTGPAEDKLENYMSTSKILGIPDVRYDLSLSGTAAADPVYTWFWKVITNSTEALTAQNTFVNVQIDYTVEFFQKNILAQS